MEHAADRSAGDSGPPGDDRELPGPERVDAGVLTALLVRHGWRRRGGESGRYTRWTPPGDPAGRSEDRPGTSLLVPETDGYGDYAELLGEAITALARSGAPSAREVLLALAVPGDEIRWRLDTPRLAGAVRWPAADQLHGAAREMLMAAARATAGRAGYFGERHTRHATACLGRVLLGPTTSGHRVTAFLPAPDCRAVAVTMLQALEATRDAVDYQRATGRTGAFDAAVAFGVSHELVVALIHLVRDSEGAEIAQTWSPAAAPPHGVAARPEVVEFTPGDLPALQLAATRYRAAEPSVRVTVTGTVVRLHSARPEAGGTIRLRVLVGADARTLRVRLGEEDYRVAVHAHLSGLPVRLTGDLEARDRFRRLTGPTALAPLRLDEAERDRLLKALEGPADRADSADPGDRSG